MAFDMKNNLLIGAVVTGAEQISKLTGNLNQVGGAASGLLKSAGPLGGALGAIAPAVTIGGITALAMKTLDAADTMHTLSQRTGVSVESLAKFKKAAGLSGTDIDSVAKSISKLSKGLYEGTSSTKELAEVTKDQSKQMVQTIKDRERDQTAIIKDQANARMDALRNETDESLKELNKRYREQEKLLGDKQSDEEDAIVKQRDRVFEQQIKSIEKQYELRKKAIKNDESLSDDAKEAALNRIQEEEDSKITIQKDAYEESQKQLKRSLRDKFEAQRSALEESKGNEEKILKASLDQQEKAINKSANDQVQALQKTSEAATEALSVDPGPKGAMQALATLSISATDASGKLKSADAVILEVANKFKTMPDGVEKTALSLQLFGKAGAEMIPMLNMGGDAIEKMGGKMTTAFAEKAHEYEMKLTMIQGKIGGMVTSLTIALIPALDAMATAVLTITDAMTKLPGWLQTTIGLTVTMGIAFTALAPALTAAAALLGGLSGLGIAATLASWVSGFATLAAGVATFVAGVVTAPVLIGAALVAAGVAIFVFRDKIGETFQNIWNTVADPKAGFIALIGMAWNNAIDAMGQYIKDLARPVVDTWNGIINSIRGVINGAIRLAGQGINALIDQANRLLNAYNAVANVTHLPQVALIQQVQVPQFAQGGMVDRPTYLMAGEAGPEYIVPKAKVPQFVGAHMGDAGLGIGAGAGRGGYAAPVVNVSSGPIMQQSDGSQWVSREDAHGMVADAVDQIWRGLTSYDGRRALGLVR